MNDEGLVLIKISVACSKCQKEIYNNQEVYYILDNDLKCKSSTYVTINIDLCCSLACDIEYKFLRV
jgi:hypothetical protein